MVSTADAETVGTDVLASLGRHRAWDRFETLTQ